MTALRKEADEAHTENEDLKAKNKKLEQENLDKEQEIKSLTHKNQVLESDVEKLELSVTDHKTRADETTQHSTQNESLTRRLAVLEEEAESADRTLRETNEK
jgi:tropomyosin, fungi type